MSDLWQPLLLSLRIAGTATAICLLIALPLSLFMARRNFIGKSLLEGLIIVPMVLPPTVVGYAILFFFGRGGAGARWLFPKGFSIVFTFEGAVLAAGVVAFPLLYLPAKSGFAAIYKELEESARLMGASRWQVFWHISLPLARRGLLSGVVLAFARALGEFGATVMVFGWSPDRLTLPISIYADYEQGNMGSAAGAAAALTICSLILIFAYNRFASWSDE